MKQFKIPPYQEQIIMGKILGDGHLETANHRTYRLKIEHSIKQKFYVDWLYEQLMNLASNSPKVKLQKVKDKIYKKYWFNTSYSGSFRFYYQQFYLNGKKIAPKLIGRWLTPLTLAVWYMDDGSVKSKCHQAKIINTQAFDLASLRRLQQALESNFEIKTKLRKQKEGYQIYILANSTPRLKEVIGKYILEGFKYKLG